MCSCLPGYGASELRITSLPSRGTLKDESGSVVTSLDKTFVIINGSLTMHYSIPADDDELNQLILGKTAKQPMPFEFFTYGVIDSNGVESVKNRAASPLNFSQQVLSFSRNSPSACSIITDATAVADEEHFL